MVILDQDHIVQSHPVIDTAADTHGFFFQHPHTRGGFSRIQDLRLQSYKLVCIPPRNRCNPAHALHNIQDRPFRLQDAQHPSLNNKSNITGIDP